MGGSAVQNSAFALPAGIIDVFKLLKDEEDLLPWGGGGGGGKFSFSRSAPSKLTLSVKSVVRLFKVTG